VSTDSFPERSCFFLLEFRVYGTLILEAFVMLLPSADLPALGFLAPFSPTRTRSGL